MRFINNIKTCFSVLFLFSILNVLGQTSNKFTIVLDAGHGGKDPGNSYHGYVEKDIALKTTLKVGRFLESEKDFDVVYTRKTDEFIELVTVRKLLTESMLIYLFPFTVIQLRTLSRKGLKLL